MRISVQEAEQGRKPRRSRRSRVSGEGSGFASMSPAMRRHYGRIGGLKAHRLGVAHTWTEEEAEEAGRKGGRISRRRKKVQEDEV